VPVDILVWPMGMKFRKGEILRLTVSGYKTQKRWTGPFKLKMAKIDLPKEGFTYMPDERPEMYTIGGAEMFGGGDVSNQVETQDLPGDINHGRQVIHTGGRFDSYLYIPAVPEK
jgi:predicted acyl esterase